MVAVPVEAPARRQHEHSLLNVGNKITPGDDHWTNRGVSFTSEGCQIIFAHTHDCWVDGTTNKGVQECTGVEVFPAYNLEMTVVWNLADINYDVKKMLHDELEVGNSAVLERLLELGVVDTADIQALLPIAVGAQSTTGVIGHVGTLTPPNFSTAQALASSSNAAECIGIVEKKLIDSADHIGAAGTLYMDPIIAALAGESLTYRDGKLITRATGSDVVVGNFGANTVYGHTGGVDIYVGDVGWSEAVDRATNEYYAQVEQPMAIVFNQCTLVKSARTAA